MPRDRQIIGDCPQCGGQQLACTYNHFEREALTIDSWEHRCADCGLRETTAYRSDDDEPLDDGIDPAVCPFCGRSPA